MKKPLKKPMLAARATLSRLKYPVLVSPKIDGIRATVQNGVVYSRSLKPIRSHYVQDKFSFLEGYDGELVVGPPNAHDAYLKTSSGVMSFYGSEDVAFHVFDRIDMNGVRFDVRFSSLHAPASMMDEGVIQFVDHILVEEEAALLQFEEECLAEGYEGVMIRDPDGYYKQGRSTVREGGLLKLKRFEDAEAVVVGYEELQHNENELGVDERGYAKRSAQRAGLVAGGTLGALTLQTPSGVWFNVGTGYTAALRAELWARRDALIGKVVKYRYQAVGVKEKPRLPVFLGFRDTEDMS